MSLRIAVASIVQETNTFSPATTPIEAFTGDGLLIGEDVRALAGTDTEAAGALAELDRLGVTGVPVLRAWAMSGGVLEAPALDHLTALLADGLRAAGRLDGVVLSLHGALSAEAVDSGDLALLRAARAAVGAACPIGICLDLHANVPAELVDESRFVIGYHTYPHVDMAATGARCAALLVRAIGGSSDPVTYLTRRPMLVPAEAQGSEGPLGRLREAADQEEASGLLDVSLFPVQPWLDLPDIGFGVLVTSDGDAVRAASVAERLAELAWDVRRDFQVDLVSPAAAIARAAAIAGPVLLVQSSDSPTAGATADSAAMVDALLAHGTALRSFVTLVDAPAVARCFAEGAGALVHLRIGGSIDDRFTPPVEIEAEVERVGVGEYELTGPVFHGMRVSVGRYARLDAGGLSVVVTERPACTFDPESYRQAGLEPADADVVLVRSATLWRAGWAGVARDAILLDIPGASSARLDHLPYRRVTRPLYPLDV